VSLTLKKQKDKKVNCGQKNFQMTFSLSYILTRTIPNHKLKKNTKVLENLGLNRQITILARQFAQTLNQTNHPLPRLKVKRSLLLNYL